MGSLWLQEVQRVAVANEDMVNELANKVHELKEKLLARHGHDTPMSRFLVENEII